MKTKYSEKMETKYSEFEDKKLQKLVEREINDRIRLTDNPAKSIAGFIAHNFAQKEKVRQAVKETIDEFNLVYYRKPLSMDFIYDNGKNSIADAVIRKTSLYNK